MIHSHALALIGALLGATSAQAQDTSITGLGFSKLSYPGDGFTPTASAVFEAQQRALESNRHAVGASPRGESGYRVSVPLPPALHAPQVGLSYSSAAGDHTLVARGWDLDVGMTIRRVTQSGELAYYGADRLYQVSGGGLEGMIVEQSVGTWAWVSNQPGAAVFEGDGNNGKWTVRAGGTTTLLAPAGNKAVAVEWRVSSSEDGSGNRYEVDWDGPTPTQIRYGGTSTEAHVVTVDFVYEPRPPSLDASVGFVEVIDDRLVGVQISTLDGPGKGDAYALELAYADDHGEARLESVWQVLALAVDPVCRACASECAPGTLLNPDGACSACPSEERHLLAAFDYTSVNWDGFGTGSVRESQWDGPLWLGDSTMSNNGVNGNTTGWSLMADSSGDGIVDLIHPGTSYLSAWGLLDFSAMPPTTVFEDVPHEWSTLDFSDPTGTSSSRAETVLCASNQTVSYTQKQLIDLNGDGYLDVVFSEAPIPEPWGEPIGSPAFCDTKLEGGPLGFTVGTPHEWLVRYGAVDGLGPVDTLIAPFAWPGVASTPRLPSADDVEDEVALQLWLLDEFGITWDPTDEAFETHSGLDQPTSIVSLVDLTGDGLPDLLDTSAVPEWAVYPGLPTGGFDLTPRTFPSALGNNVFRETSSVSNGELDLTSLTLDNVDPLDGDTGVGSIDVLGVRSVQFGHTRVKSRLIDLNADGFTDYVVATGDQSWTVHLNTGSEFVAVSWSAPGPYVSVSEEGIAWGKSCSVSAPNVGELLGDALQPTPSDPAGRGSEPEEPGAAFNSVCGQRFGIPSRVMQALLDVDGDNKVDFVDMYSRTWWRNTGGGFADEGLPVPTWWPDAISATQRNQAVFFSAEVLLEVAAGNLDYYNDNVVPTLAVSEQLSHLTDLDGDGMLDAVVAVAGETGVAPGAEQVPWTSVLDGDWDVRWGTYPRPGLLDEVTIPTGAQTTLAYESSSWAWPSGDSAGNHRRSNRADLLTQIETVDPVTGHAGKQEIVYEDGVCIPGKCLGFEVVEQADFRCDPELQATCSGASASWVEFGSTRTTYDLARDFQQPVDRVLVAPEGNPQDKLPPITRVWEQLAYDRRPLAAGTIEITSSWPSARDVAHYGDAGLAGSDRFIQLSVVRDAVGNVTEAHHVFPADPLQDVSTTTTWLSSADGSVWVPSEQWTVGFDRTTGTYATVERARFAYDGGSFGAPPTAGLMTAQEVDAGRADVDLAAEVLQWKFDRGARGQILDIYAPAGMETHYSDFTFGAALPQRQSNALGHETLTTYDFRGRVVATTDPNGVVDSKTLDGLGREVARSTQGVGGAVYPVSETAFDQCEAPTRMTQTTFDFATPTSTADTSVSHVVLDGFGDETQTARPDSEGTGFLVQETIRDIAGTIVRESYPHIVAGTLSDDWEADRDLRYTTWLERDAFGVSRMAWSDYHRGTGLIEASVPEPGVVETVDLVDRIHRSTSDSHGRLVEVVEGQIGQGDRTTGAYTYDGRGRIATFEDANHNTYRYAWDGAGRLRQVGRRAALSALPVTPAGCPGVRVTQLYGTGSGVGGTTGPGVGPGACGSGGVGLLLPSNTWQPWYSYDYDGPFPIEMFEGGDDDLSEPTELVATWTYDKAGRTLVHEVLERGSMTFEPYTWEWDLDPATGLGWIGAVRHTSDPAGDVYRIFGPGDFGDFGDPLYAIRQWSHDNHADVFGTTYDFQRRPVEVQWPEGELVSHTFDANGWHQSSQVVLPNGDFAEVQYSFDSFGLRAGFDVDIDGALVKHLPVGNPEQRGGIGRCEVSGNVRFPVG